jgi:uncharacterized protein (TIGR02246 family)
MGRSNVPPRGSPDAIEAEFYEALQRGDLERLMAVWLDDDDISCVHPGGARLLGAAAIRAAFEALFSHGAVDARPERIRRLQSSGCAVHSVVERVAVMTADGAQTGWVVATNVYVETAEGWRLAAHHASPGSAAAVPDAGEGAAVLH